jgi:hypothetical protein
VTITLSLAVVVMVRVSNMARRMTIATTVKVMGWFSMVKGSVHMKLTRAALCCPSEQPSRMVLTRRGRLVVNTLILLPFFALYGIVGYVETLGL